LDHCAGCRNGKRSRSILNWVDAGIRETYQKVMYKKTVTGNYEELIDHARELLEKMEAFDAMHHLKDGGIEPEFAYLAVKAANILREPYVYQEKEDRIVDPGDV